MHYAAYTDTANNTPILAGDVVSGGNIYSTIHFASIGIIPSAVRAFYRLGSARTRFNVPRSSSVVPTKSRRCLLTNTGDPTGLDPVYLCLYTVGATDEGQYRIEVTTATRDVLNQKLMAKFTSSAVTISALRFDAGTTITDQSYTVGQEVALTLPESTTGAAPLSYTLRRIGNDDPEARVVGPGLTFYAENRTIRGMTTLGFGPADLRYTVMDDYGSSEFLDFRQRVFVAPAL